MGLKLPAVLLLAAVLLAGCSTGGAVSQPDPSPPREPPAPVAEPAADKLTEEAFVDDPDSPYPMAVERWSVDMDGDGADELVELRAEKAYFGNESGSGQLFEGKGMHPYKLVVTRGETVHELPLGWEDNGSPPLSPYYWDEERTGRSWTRDRAGRPVLVLWFDTISAGGAGNIDVYAVALQDGEPVLLPVPMYGIQATLDEETMISQVTVPETGCTETLDLMEWLAIQERRNREHGHDYTFEPIYSEDGALEWPAAPGHIDGFYHAEKADEGILLRQYIWGSAHVDGMGALVTTLSWENGEAVVLDQHFDWD